MKTPSIWLVVGARPNFVKAAPVWHALREYSSVVPRVVHTGQHYDAGLSAVFFDDLELPEPDHRLAVDAGTHAVQTADVTRAIEPLLRAERPDCVVVFGDVNSTVAAALAAAKLGLSVAHVESGLRSFDKSMPEEINRVVTDAVSDLLFVTEAAARANLEREGVSPERIHFVGNTMIDSLDRTLRRARARRPDLLRKLGLANRPYGVLTLHRPLNVDRQETLIPLVRSLDSSGPDLPLVFPVHPRTRAVIEAGDWRPRQNVRAIEPLGYVNFLAILDGAEVALTDSGGIQEETTVLGIPCLTLRSTTERPVTVEKGSSRLVGNDPQAAISALEHTLAEQRARRPVRPEKWDGSAGRRVAAQLVGLLLGEKTARRL